MPRYEFSCPTCGQIFEKVVAINGDQSEIRCPSGHRHVLRVYSAPAILFKGTGFYTTDHRSGSDPATKGD